jgi:hypothetical protein
MMVKKLLFVAASAVMAAWLSGGPLLSKSGEGILVLGFDSAVINDIQDRLLRESVMRQLQVAGFPIVPVMEIESIIRNDHKRQIRKLNREEMKGFCDELGAGYACCGSIVPETATADDRIKSGINYICVITVFNSNKKTFSDVKIKIAGEDNLYRFYAVLSKKIVADIAPLL